MLKNINSIKKYKKPTIFYILKYNLKLLSYLWKNILIFPWIIYFLIKNKLSPVIIAYTNSSFSEELNPAMPKNLLFESLEKNKDVIKFLSKTLFVPFNLLLDDKYKIIKDFLSKNNISYPIIAKPNDGARSIGAFIVDNEDSLFWLLKEINIDYLLQEYQKGEIEAGLYYMRSINNSYPSQYGIAIKYDVYGDTYSPHDGLTSLRSKFFVKNLTNFLTPELENVINLIADATAIDIGRIDIITTSIDDLFKKPIESIKILEVNVGFDTIDLHATDFDDSFIYKLKMIKNRWFYVLELGRNKYLSAPTRIKLKTIISHYLNYDSSLGFVKKKLHTPNNA